MEIGWAPGRTRRNSFGSRGFLYVLEKVVFFDFMFHLQHENTSHIPHTSILPFRVPWLRVMTEGMNWRWWFFTLTLWRHGSLIKLYFKDFFHIDMTEAKTIPVRLSRSFNFWIWTVFFFLSLNWQDKLLNTDMLQMFDKQTISNKYHRKVVYSNPKRSKEDNEHSLGLSQTESPNQRQEGCNTTQPHCN